MIIGLTGSYCSGKDTVADYIVNKYNFKHFSLSDEIRLLMKQANIEPTRENLISFGTNLRQTQGNDVLAKSVIKKFEQGKNYCITSIRHTKEVEKLKTIEGFVLINVDAPQQIRFERMQKRKRPGDPATLEKFVELEKKEAQSSGSGQQVALCCKMADIIFINDTNDINQLYSNIDKLVKEIKNKYE
ncbi:AAA family ATPase [Candidatus Ruminimicrobium bovinum]|uniref:AAA family ATPase n=1 Tax=Candidatus Ruminimicrobium bovinum TaxID=3242779 RepID=UPI0039B929F6